MSRILHLLSQIPSKTGSGVFLDNILKQAHDAGHEQALVVGLPISMEDLEIFTPLKGLFPLYFETEELPFKIPGMSDVMPYDSTKFSDLSLNQWRAYHAAFEYALSKAIDTFEPDIILANHLWMATAIGVDLCKFKTRSKRPRIYAISHGTDLRQMHQGSPTQTIDWIKEKCQALDGVFCLHTQQMAEIEQVYGLPKDKLILLGNGYNAEVFHRHRRTLRDETYLIYAGKLSYSKGVLELIEAVEMLSKKMPLRLELVGKGSGAESDEIRRRIDAVNQQRQTIECLGFLTQEDLATTFMESDLFVLPSFYEGLPLVVLEAMATGLPVVVNNFSGLHDWLGGVINASGYITYVPMPPLTAVDQIKKTARDAYIISLAAALEKQIHFIKIKTEENLFPYEAIESHSWQNVFRIINHYVNHTI